MKSDTETIKLGIIIQARMGSSRLPGKILKKIGTENTVIGCLIRRFGHEEANKNNIVIATTTNQLDNALVEYLTANHPEIPVFRGEENNVLNRFITCAKQYGFTHIVRVCSDNPMLNIRLLDNLVEEFMKDPSYDYYSYYNKELPVIKTHFGVFAELIAVNALGRVEKDFVSKLNQEHVTIGLYENEKHFKIMKLDLTNELAAFEGIRLSLDTAEDLINIEDAQRLVPEHADYKEVFTRISNNQDLLNRMQAQILKQKK